MSARSVSSGVQARPRVPRRLEPEGAWLLGPLALALALAPIAPACGKTVQATAEPEPDADAAADAAEVPGSGAEGGSQPTGWREGPAGPAWEAPCDDPGLPLATTIQRLNRLEYDRTFRDLLGDDTHPASELPIDGSAEGFDNIADALTVSPLYLEKHERAVTEVVDRMLSRPVATAEVLHFEAEDIGSETGTTTGLAWLLWSNGSLVEQVEVPEDGMWLVTVRAWAKQAGPELAEMLVVVDGQSQTFQVGAADGESGLYSLAVPLEAGPRGFEVRFTNDYYDEPAGEDRNLFVDWIRFEGPYPEGLYAQHEELGPETGLDPYGPLEPGQPLALAGTIEVTGTWRLDVRGRLDPGLGPGAEAAQLTLRSGSKPLISLDLEPGPFDQASASALLGEVPSVAELTLMTDTPVGVDFVRLVGPLDVPQPPPDPAFEAFFTCEPATPSKLTSCASELLERFARQAWRRPVEQGELAPLLALVEEGIDEGADFEEAVRYGVRAVLLSPHFLFRPQPDAEPEPDQPRDLTDHEIASRLSYALWSSIPDETLDGLADAGILNDVGNLAVEARRMLDDPRSDALIEGFAAQWLQLRALDDVIRDSAKFPDFTAELREAMRRETELVFEELLHSPVSFLGLLTADFTYADELLGQFYGLPTYGGETFKRVSTEGTIRRGILTHASFLTVTSHTFRTSPVKRGKWVLGQLLCDEPSPPPPDVEALVDQAEDMEPQSVKALLEAHITDPVCAGCHAKMDPIGLGLESFDAIGAFRTEDAGEPIDPTGELWDGRTFEGPVELAALLEEDPDFARCVAQQMFTYLLGRPERDEDGCLVDQLTEAWSQDGYVLEELIVHIVTSDAFRRRLPQPLADPTRDDEGAP